MTKTIKWNCHSRVYGSWGSYEKVKDTQTEAISLKRWYFQTWGGGVGGAGRTLQNMIFYKREMLK